MKFFTHEWWQNDCPKAEEVFARYNEHLNSISHLLPTSILKLKEESTLHDSELKSCSCHFENQTVTLVFKGWNTTFDQKLRYILNFSGVVSFSQKLPEFLEFDRELDDLGYWECHHCSEGIEVRMLFATGAEFRIIFSDFELLTESRS